MQKSYSPTCCSLQDLSPTVVARFWKYVDKTDGCWPWTGTVGGTNQYGVIRHYKRRKICAHRLSWIIANNRPIPDGLQVLHRCDNPRCVNPDHLFLGTQTDNIRDCMAKGRFRKNSGIKKSRTVSNEQVIEIRRMSLTRTYSEVASAYGISPTTVARIVRREFCYALV